MVRHFPGQRGVASQRHSGSLFDRLAGTVRSGYQHLLKSQRGAFPSETVRRMDDTTGPRRSSGEPIVIPVSIVDLTPEGGVASRPDAASLRITPFAWDKFRALSHFYQQASARLNYYGTEISAIGITREGRLGPELVDLVLPQQPLIADIFNAQAAAFLTVPGDARLIREADRLVLLRADGERLPVTRTVLEFLTLNRDQLLPTGSSAELNALFLNEGQLREYLSGPRHIRIRSGWDFIAGRDGANFSGYFVDFARRRAEELGGRADFFLHNTPAYDGEFIIAEMKRLSERFQGPGESSLDFCRRLLPRMQELSPATDRELAEELYHQEAESLTQSGFRWIPVFKFSRHDPELFAMKVFDVRNPAVRPIMTLSELREAIGQARRSDRQSISALSELQLRLKQYAEDHSDLFWRQIEEIGYDREAVERFLRGEGPALPESPGLSAWMLFAFRWLPPLVRPLIMSITNETLAESFPPSDFRRIMIEPLRDALAQARIGEVTIEDAVARLLAAGVPERIAMGAVIEVISRPAPAAAEGRQLFVIDAGRPSSSQALTSDQVESLDRLVQEVISPDSKVHVATEMPGGRVLVETLSDREPPAIVIHVVTDVTALEIWNALRNTGLSSDLIERLIRRFMSSPGENPPRPGDVNGRHWNGGWQEGERLMRNPLDPFPWLEHRRHRSHRKTMPEPWTAQRLRRMSDAQDGSRQSSRPMNDGITLVHNKLTVQKPHYRAGREKTSAFMSEAWDQLANVLRTQSNVPETDVERKVALLMRAFDRIYRQEDQADMGYEATRYPTHLAITIEVNGGREISVYSVPKSVGAAARNGPEFQQPIGDEGYPANGENLKEASILKEWIVVGQGTLTEGPLAFHYHQSLTKGLVRHHIQVDLNHTYAGHIDFVYDPSSRRAWMDMAFEPRQLVREAIHVESEFRQQGIGHRLLELAAVIVQMEGAQSFTAKQVYIENAAFYLHAGFHVIHRPKWFLRWALDRKSRGQRWPSWVFPIMNFRRDFDNNREKRTGSVFTGAGLVGLNSSDSVLLIAISAFLILRSPWMMSRLQTGFRRYWSYRQTQRAYARTERRRSRFFLFALGWVMATSIYYEPWSLIWQVPVLFAPPTLHFWWRVWGRDLIKQAIRDAKAASSLPDPSLALRSA